MTTKASSRNMHRADSGIMGDMHAGPAPGRSYEEAVVSNALAVLSIRSHDDAIPSPARSSGQQEPYASPRARSWWPDAWQEPSGVRLEAGSGSGRGSADTPNSRRGKCQSPGSGGSPQAFGTTAREFEEMLASITRACKRTDSGAYSDSSEATTVVSEEFFGQPPEEPDWLMASMAPKSRQSSFVNSLSGRPQLAGQFGTGSPSHLGASPLGMVPSAGLDSTSSGGPDSMRHFYQRSTTSGVYEVLGGWEGLTAAVERLFRELGRDPRVGGALDAIDALKLKHRLFTLLGLVLAGRECPEDVRLWEGEWLAAADLPLSVEHFDVVIEHIMATLDNLTGDPAVMDNAASILSRQRNVLRERSSRTLSSDLPSALLDDERSSSRPSHQHPPAEQEDSLEPLAPRSGHDSGDGSGDSGDFGRNGPGGGCSGGGGSLRWDASHRGSAGDGGGHRDVGTIVPPWLMQRGGSSNCDAATAGDVSSSGGGAATAPHLGTLHGSGQASPARAPPSTGDTTRSTSGGGGGGSSGGGGGGRSPLHSQLLNHHRSANNRSVPLPSPYGHDATALLDSCSRSSLWPRHITHDSNSGRLLMTSHPIDLHHHHSRPLHCDEGAGEDEDGFDDGEGDDYADEGDGGGAASAFRHHHFLSGSNAVTLSAEASTSSLPLATSISSNVVLGAGGCSGPFSQPPQLPVAASLHGRSFVPSNTSSLRASFGSSSSGLIAVAALRRAGASANAER